MAKKKSKKKVKAKQVSQEKSKGSTAKEVMVDGPADKEQVKAPAAIAAEPMCYTRGRGQTKHMTVAEHNKLRGK